MEEKRPLEEVYAVVFMRRAYRFPPGDRGGVPTDRDPAVHPPPDQEFDKVRFLQGYQKADGRLKAGVCRRKERNPKRYFQQMTA